MPTEIPGVAFLSGGQSEFEATEKLDQINKQNKSSFAFTYSYGRALQQSALKTWAKNLNDTETVQKVFGEDRLLYGSDWPVCLLAGNYSKVKNLAEYYFPIKSNKKYWSENAIKIYNLNI